MTMTFSEQQGFAGKGHSMAENENSVTPGIIRPPDTLRSKVKEGGPGAVDLEALERAEAVVAGLANNYLEWVEDDLKVIQERAGALAVGADDWEQAVDKVFQTAHDMKGQGGSFGFELITAIGNNLCRLIDRFDDTVTPQVQNEAIRIHIEAMKLVIGSRMKGDGGDQGTAILEGVQQMVLKLVPMK